MNKMSNTGFLELIIGPMFSGKTTYLLSLHKQYALSNMKTCVINYSEDKRYHNSKLSTHDKVMIECNNTLTLKAFLTDDIIDNHEVFLINEGQFFDDLYECVVSLVETHNKIVHICGLDGDFKRNAFGDIIRLIPLSDNIVKKHAICSFCADGTNALFSHRLTNEQSVKIIGSSNYVPLCRKCYVSQTKLDTIQNTKELTIFNQ